MKWKSFILGAAVGFIGGYAVKEILSQKTNVSPEKVLETVKKQFKEHGPISGSWIHMKAESYEKHPMQYHVYKGGISRTNHGENEQFEFIADASSGTILDIRKFSNEL
ncbi:PepSY domain-containing protein [Neobacillus massiliamazoniensis]|jgi:predicted small secreted protein|uniref:Proteptide PepSY amd peptidase M4 n=1 Tax=Neobacillus massiliamazoniensis TaxID=1499688 RepID=A0A0U1P2L7_9BACI|nr:PepSY domain-containing protein [Neobacillus massiliamazoniensis]CRK84447.1 proteptide PepSY amd peptidase M4 [Neobacillus massiliamazoniensis]